MFWIWGLVVMKEKSRGRWTFCLFDPYCVFGLCFLSHNHSLASIVKTYMTVCSCFLGSACLNVEVCLHSPHAILHCASPLKAIHHQACIFVCPYRSISAHLQPPNPPSSNPISPPLILSQHTHIFYQTHTLSNQNNAHNTPLHPRPRIPHPPLPPTLPHHRSRKILHRLYLRHLPRRLR
jgi:hypothetical protein